MQPSVSIKPQYMAWQLVNKSGLIIKEGEQHNMVLNQAKDQMATHGMDGITAYAVIGTGSTAPAVGQTGLVAESARTNAIPSGLQDEVVRVSNGVYDIKRVRQFASIGGLNLTEWGFSPNNVAGNNLAVRELFRDGSNNPITITPNNDQFLRIFYVTRVTLSPLATAPTSVSINISGLAAPLRTGKLWATGYKYRPEYQFADFETFNALMKGAVQFFVHDQRWTENYNEQIYATLSPRPVRTANAYVLGSKTRTYPQQEFGVNDLNSTICSFSVGQEIQSGLVFNLDVGQEFTKDNAHKLTLDNFGVSWT
jgi:hypothetical protein